MKFGTIEEGLEEVLIARLKRNWNFLYPES